MAWSFPRALHAVNDHQLKMLQVIMCYNSVENLTFYLANPLTFSPYLSSKNGLDYIYF